MRKSVLLFVSSCALLGCAPSVLHVDLSSHAALNPDEHSRSLPVVIALYQLTDEDRFQHASFDDLEGDPKGALQETLLKSHTAFLSPHSRRHLVVERHPDAHVICAVGLFRKPPLEQWRACEPLRAHQFSPTIAFRVIQNRITLIPQEPSWSR